MTSLSLLCEAAEELPSVSVSFCTSELCFCSWQMIWNCWIGRAWCKHWKLTFCLCLASKVAPSVCWSTGSLLSHSTGLGDLALESRWAYGWSGLTLTHSRKRKQILYRLFHVTADREKKIPMPGNLNRLTEELGKHTKLEQLKEGEIFVNYSLALRSKTCHRVTDIFTICCKPQFNENRY